MTVKERIQAIRLMETASKNSAYAKQIGISTETKKVEISKENNGCDS